MYEDVVRRLRKIIKMHKEIYGGSTEESVAIEQAADAIEDLIAALTASNEVIAKNKPCWISVTEKLPEENGYYLTYVESAIFPNSYYFNMIKFIDGNFIEDHCVIHRVTHWQPLPEPPKEET